MTYDDLAQWTKQIGAGEKLSTAVKQKINAELPAFIQALSPETAPARLRLPTGELLTNATRITALKCQCILLARIAAGANFHKANAEYEALARDLLFYVMRHAFNSKDPKGIFCCPPCTLSLLPLYELSCFRWVDGAELAANVRRSLSQGTSVFARIYPKAYAEWALNFIAVQRLNLNRAGSG